MKGEWDEISSEYSISARNYGWMDGEIENGTYFKIPHKINSVNSKSIKIGDKNIIETFWFIGDTNWDAIMVNPGYFDSDVKIGRAHV